MNNTSNDGFNTEEETSYPNYNVRIRMPRPEMIEWCDAHSMPVRVFLTYDGGGANGHIFEFRERKHAMHFMTRFDINHGRMWIEHAPASANSAGDRQ